jgi:dTDP-4-amino-4,6-dideoxygalactose transaminase
MRVPFLDIAAIHAAMRPDLDEAYQRVMDSGWFILGKELSAFEQEFAEYCGVKHCIGVGNGLDALFLTLKAHGIGEGDEVLVPANTFIASLLAISYTRATPVLVEPTAETYNINPALLRQAISPKTRAIMPVHLYGQPADMTPICEVAAEHGLVVIEDAAQAHGAQYFGRAAGSLGQSAGFSFYPGKNLGALGDGGAITTNDDEFADKLRVMRNYGSRVKYHHEVRGVNSRLDELQAAFLRAKLRTLDSWNDRRREIAARYSDAFRNSALGIPYVPSDIDPCWHLYVVRHANRDRLQADLAKAGIETLIHYPIPLNHQVAYSDTAISRQSIPVTEQLHREILSLPMSPVMTDDSVSYVIDKCLKLACD